MESIEMFDFLFQGKMKDEKIYAGKINSQLGFSEVPELVNYTHHKEKQYFHMCSHDASKLGKGRGTNASALGLFFLWADIDTEEKPDSHLNSKTYFPTKRDAFEWLESLDQPPTVIVESQYGYHAYWKLDKKYSAQEYKHSPKEWIKGYLTDNLPHGIVIDPVVDLARVLGVPGSTKAGFELKVVKFDGDLIYPLSSSPLESSSTDINSLDIIDSIIINKVYTPPDSKFAKMMSNSYFNKIWNKDIIIGDGSNSSYDFSLLSLVAQHAWTPQEMANLLVSYRVKWKCFEEKGSNRVDYYKRSILKVCDEYQIDINSIQDTLHTSDSVINALSKMDKSDLKVSGCKLVAESELSEIDLDECIEYVFAEMKGVKKSSVRKQIMSFKRLDYKEESTGDRWINNYNSKYALFTGGGRTEILDIEDNCLNNRLVKDAFLTMTANDKIGDEGKGQLWIEHPKRRDIHEIVMDPDLEPGVSGSLVNMWNGFNIEPNEYGSSDKFWELTNTIICSNDESRYQYVRKWMAHAIQKTGEIPGIALVLQGQKGTGKNIFADTFGHIFGPNHYYMEPSLQGLFDDKNPRYGKSIVIFANEATWGGDKRHEGMLKSLITDKTKKLREMYKNPIDVKNMTRLIIASNEEWVIPATEEERRFLFCNVSNKKRQNRTYFGAIINELEKENGYGKILFDLLNEDLVGFDVGDLTSISNDGLKSQISRGLSSSLEWFGDCIFDWPWATNEIRNDVFIMEYIIWCKNHNRKPLSKRKLGIDIKNNFCYELSSALVDGKMTQVKIFPPVEALKDIWNEKFGEL